MAKNKIEDQINSVIHELENPHVDIRGKGKLIGKLRSSRDLAKNEIEGLKKKTNEAIDGIEELMGSDNVYDGLYTLRDKLKES